MAERLRTIVDAHRIQSHNVGNYVSEVWVVVSEPMERPSEEDWSDDVNIGVHGAFDDMVAAETYASELQRADRDRFYAALRVRPLDRATYERLR